MAVRVKNRKRNKRRKFSVNDKVEVRSVEEEFHGSWHCGAVTEFSKHGWGWKYAVKYDHILVDDGSHHLVDNVYVSKLLIENDCSTVNQCSYRGRIRPVPPSLEFGKWGLAYGICVDVFYNEGWWEGVVFDHDDGSEERKIFFPDLGDEMISHIDMIRITQDWNDVTWTWKNRGTWLFLELIEEYEKEYYVPVSTKQLWYDLRERDNFQKLVEWTSTERDMWKILVWETIGDNLNVVVNHLLQVTGFSEDGWWLFESAEPFSDVNKHTESDLAQNHSTVPAESTMHNNMLYPNSPNFLFIQERSNMQQLTSLSMNARPSMHLFAESNLFCQKKPMCMLPQVSGGLPSNQDVISVFSSATNDEGFSSSETNKISRKYSSSMCSKSSWQPVGPDMVPGPEFCADAAIKYAHTGEKSLINDVRKHISYLNWKIEHWRDSRHMNRLRYTSPSGMQYYSLRKVCLVLSENDPRVLSSMSHDESTNLLTSAGDSAYLLIEQSTGNQDSVVSSCSNEFHVEPKYCPAAAVDWYEFGYEKRLTSKKKREDIQQMTLRAKKHLSALGWSFSFVNHNGRHELRYISPEGKQYNSLRVACKDSMVKFRNTMALKNIKVGGIRKIQKKRKKRLYLASGLHRQEANSDAYYFLPGMKKGRNRSGFVKLQNSKKGTWSNHVLRSSKRVHQVVDPNPSHQKPQTVLSWLIDNNVVLPRAKVRYCNRKGKRPIAEGRITRDGIKCNCCGKVFTLSSFQFHVSGKCCRPSASIFLEDGRSLLDCQKEIMHEEMRTFAAEPPESLKGSWHHGENDHICSVCHYGGELILCDQCPSSFHKSCLGMVDVPGGDWFCPSCCCRICCQNKLKGNPEYYTDDDNVLNCTQCERKYHIGCLRIKGEDNLGCFYRGNWFCCKKCEMIFLGLQKLLGKPISVGLNNLTWTLLKSSTSDSHMLDASDEAWTENYIKLNVALDVMHECFEPVEEPRTKRDLLKDVIFSKGSELNRLNFRGFYAVLLQKNEEFITVATVRVYGEVAEIPLVGTRFQYRRLGMCRILMDVLEKKLMELGVQRLILPAVPSLLNTWSGSFGFSKMTDSERLQFVDYTFLDFQDTVMCHKQLTKIPSTEYGPSKVHFAEDQPTLHKDASGSCDNIDLDGASAVSHISQAHQIEGGIVEQGQVDVAASNSSSDGEGCIHPVDMVNHPSDSFYEPHAGEISWELSVENSTFKQERRVVDNSSNVINMGSRYGMHGDLKGYKRRTSTYGS